jgi:hypothetical protein
VSANTGRTAAVVQITDFSVIRFRWPIKQYVCHAVPAIAPLKRFYSFIQRVPASAKGLKDSDDVKTESAPLIQLPPGGWRDGFPSR